MGYLQTIRYRTIASTSSFHVASSGCARKVSENSILWRKICPRRRASAPASRNLPFHTPNPRKIGRAFHPAAGARNEPRVTAAARTATRHACGSSISHTLRRQLNQPRATAAACTAMCYAGGNPNSLALPPLPARQRATAATQSSTRYGGGNPHKNGVAAKATAPPKRCATSACGRGS